MICYGRNAIYPTVHFERCREGAEDFYLFSTLRKRIERTTAAGRAGPAVTAAERLLAETAGAIPLNRRSPPAGYDPYRLKDRLIAAIEALGDGGE